MATLSTTALVSNGLLLHGTCISCSKELLNALLHSLKDIMLFCGYQILLRNYWKEWD